MEKPHTHSDKASNSALKLQLILGEFSTAEAVELITQMIQIKIRYHEKKIADHSLEEDIKYREAKIKSLQNELATLRQSVLTKGQSMRIEASLNLTQP